jgi:2,6-dihydroxypseudooxynicotine hydrolase
MAFKGGRLELLVPHLLRSQLLRPGFVRLSLRLGAAQQMPAWAKLQFTNAGVAPADLERVLARVTDLESWVAAWTHLGRGHEHAAAVALAEGRDGDAGRHGLAASAAYNFAQLVVFLDITRKRALHEACVRAYAQAAPLLDPPARPFEVVYRRRAMRGMLRLPRGVRPAPVVVMFNGTNAVKEELHWWSDALLERGLATLLFDGPGLGQTFHRLSMVAEPRPVGTAILDAIESHPGLNGAAVAFAGQSLGGYMAIRMAAHDRRVRAVAAVSPPYSIDVYWRITLAGMRRELAALYGVPEPEMGEAVERLTLADCLPALRTPLFVAGGGHDLLTPGREAWRIFEDARCDRELVFYPKGAHDCFNVLADLRPRVAGWVARRLAEHRAGARAPLETLAPDALWRAAEAVDPDFADALCGEVERPRWTHAASPGLPVDFAPAWGPPDPARRRVQVVHRLAAAEA